jgi:hypothetical protein
LEYFEREKVVESNDPIVSSDAHVLYRAAALMDGKDGALRRLLDLAIPRVVLIAQRDGTDRSDRSDRSGGVYWWVRDVPWDSGGWHGEIAPARAEIGWVRTDENERRDEPRAEPIFFVGIFYNRPSPLTIEQIRNPSWEIGEDVWVRIERNWARISSGLYVSDLAVRGVTLTTQAEALADWANKAFGSLRALRDPRELRGVGELALRDEVPPDSPEGV